MIDWQEAYYDLVNKVECECVQQGDLVPIWEQFKRMSLTIQKLQGNQAALEAELAKYKALAETLAGVLDRIYMEDRRIVERWRQSAVTGDSHLDERIVLGRYAEIAAEALREYKEAHDV